MNRLQFIILSCMKNSDITHTAAALTINELSTEIDLTYSYNAYQKQLSQLVVDGYVKKGLKDGNSNTYYITKKGIDAVDEIRRNQE